MAFRRPRVAGVFLLAWGSFGFKSVPPQPPAPIPAAEPEADAAAVQRLAEEFFAACARKDLEGFLQLWSPRSPDLAARKQEMQTLFAANEKIEVKTLIVSNVTLADAKASMRATVEMSAVAAKTGQPAAGFGETNRALHFVREDGTWRIWREAPAAEDLALALLEAQTRDERAALLATEKELVTAGLWRALDAQGDRIWLQGDYARALAAYALEQ